MPYKDPELRKQYDRQRSKERYDRRMGLLAQYDCCLCGECDSDLIDWHHIDPSLKEFALCQGSSEDRWWEEVLKCIPVCALCHRKIHSEKLCLLPISL